MKLLVTIILAFILHLLLGWAWTILAGLVVGLWKGSGGWWVGGLGVGLSWLGLILYNFSVAAEPVGRMTAVLGGILGNLPGLVVIAATLLIGLLLGTVGGGLGTQTRLLIKQRDIVAKP